MKFSAMSSEQRRHDPTIRTKVRETLESQRKAASDSLALVQEAHKLMSAVSHESEGMFYNEARSVSITYIRLEELVRLNDSIGINDTYVGNYAAGALGEAIAKKLD